jgi:hypothetical protein
MVMMILTLTASSQIDTENKLKCLKPDIIKLMIKDIIIGDSALAELKLAQTYIDSLESKNERQVQKINLLEDKFKSCEEIVGIQKSKLQLYELDNKNLEKKLKSEKLKNKINKISSVGIIAFLTFLLIKK